MESRDRGLDLECLDRGLDLECLDLESEAPLMVVESSVVESSVVESLMVEGLLLVEGLSPVVEEVEVHQDMGLLYKQLPLSTLSQEHQNNHTKIESNLDTHCLESNTIQIAPLEQRD